MPKAELEAAHSRRRNLKRHIAAKMADMISHACRLSYQLYILSNRIVKPNNRYTRLPASHDFLFYSAPDKVYVLTATNRIAMRFAVRSAPPFRYLNAPTIPKAELEAAHSRRRNLKRLIAAKTAGTFYPCLPFIVSIVYPIKPHCKVK